MGDMKVSLCKVCKQLGCSHITFDFLFGNYLHSQFFLEEYEISIIQKLLEKLFLSVNMNQKSATALVGSQVTNYLNYLHDIDIWVFSEDGKMLSQYYDCVCNNLYIYERPLVSWKKCMYCFNSKHLHLNFYHPPLFDRLKLIYNDNVHTYKILDIYQSIIPAAFLGNYLKRNIQEYKNGCAIIPCTNIDIPGKNDAMLYLSSSLAPLYRTRYSTGSCT
jgi:hypothetical protein